MGKRPITGPVVPAKHDSTEFARQAIQEELDMVDHVRRTKVHGVKPLFTDGWLDEKERSLREALAALDAEEHVAE